MTHAEFLELSAAEEEKVLQLEAAVAADVQSSPSLRAFCNRSCYVRYLRARSWNVAKATKMLQETLKWRASYKPEQIRWEDVQHEVADGKLFVMEHPDKEGRPVVLMRPRNETSHNVDTRIKSLVYTLEQASRRADESSPDGKMAWLVDFVGYTRKNAPPIKVSLQTLHILQNHYPERLGKAVSYIPPVIFDLMWRAVSPFIDPVTHQKLVFLNKKAAAAGHLGDHFHLEHLDTSLGGALEVEAVFDMARLEARYRLADAETDRRLLALTNGGAGSAAATPSAAAAATAAAAAAAAGLEAGSSGAEPSVGVSAGSSSSSGSSEGGYLREEGSRSVAGVGSVRSVSLEGQGGEEEAQSRGAAAEELAVGVGALKVA